MNVVWHYHPRRQPVLVLIVKEQRVLNHSSEPRLFQMTIAVTLIEISFHSTTHNSFNLARLLELQLFFPARKYCTGQCVVQAEGDELGQFAAVEMREITAAVPT